MSGRIDFTIRDMQPPDLETVKKLVDRTIDTTYPAFYCREAVEFFKEHHARDKIERSARQDDIVVLIFAGDIVGTGTLAGDEIVRVFVDPAHQGYGFGKAIMEELEGRAWHKGITAIRIDASLPSLDFYHARGYETTEVTFHPVAHGRRLDYEKMVKKLAH